jgi:hypothetical protein
MRLAKSVPARITAQMLGAEQIANSLAEKLPPDVTRMVVAQSYLPFLWRSGVLAARDFEVVLTRLPLSALHTRLDDAARRYPERETLTEHRAPQSLVDAEREALASADVIHTLNLEVAAMFPKQAQPLFWKLPSRSAVLGEHIIFVGPTVARKGAYELREVMRELRLPLTVLGKNLEGAGFWEGVEVRTANEDWLAGAAVVIQPALVEDNPRKLLAALSARIPVIATAACGLPESPLVQIVSYGDVAALKQALTYVLSLKTAAHT